MKRIHKTRVKKAAVLAAIAVAAGSIPAPAAGLTASAAEIQDTQVPLYSKPAGSYVRTPIASGASTYKNEKVILDASNLSEGYIMVKYTGSNPKIKVQISKSGSETYTYDLNTSGSYEVFPLSEGSGTYSVKVFENIQGTQYSQAFSQDISASISNQFGPFLYPNQYVNFNGASAAVQTGSAVAAGASDQIGVVTAVYNYVINNITYDTAKAASVQSGYLPNVDVVLSQKKGICFDYAALMTAMLRSQDIPTKLVVGYSGNLYHAWISVYLEGQGWVDDVIYFDGTSWKLMDPTFASSSGQSKEIMQYIGDGSNYRAKYSY
ncbi:MAG: transglutaminase-like domain-containing protein [Clostridium sp.]|nr:transglutaminase-like domain-containing protein [Clostridium sp.]